MVSPSMGRQSQRPKRQVCLRANEFRVCPEPHLRKHRGQLRVDEVGGSLRLS
jgi:hypothetical protein